MKWLRMSIVCVALAWATGRADATPPPVWVLPITGPISAATTDFVDRGLARAVADHAQLVVLQMDTPGGLDSAMRSIIKAILASPVPVATLVAPGGARAASAGTYILYASHIAAMAPGTNLGAATPVQIGLTEPPDPKSAGKPEGNPDARGGEAGGHADAGDDHQSTMTRKQTNDAAAYIRGLAQLRGRNAEWAEHAVRQAVSLSSDEARAQHVIDLNARDVTDLLRQLDRRKLMVASGERMLETAGAPVVSVEPDWRSRLLGVIADPSIAMILMLIGVYGLFFEFSSPGFILPGVAGAVCLVLGLFALQTLPLNYAGAALALLGVGFMIAEMFVPSFGALGIGGTIALVVGAVMLVDTDTPGLGISPVTIAMLAAAAGIFVFLMSSFALKARRRPLVSRADRMLGSPGEMLTDAGPDGWARVQGETWSVRSAVPLQRGRQVRVIARNGLELTVTPLEQSSTGATGD